MRSSCGLYQHLRTDASWPTGDLVNSRRSCGSAIHALPADESFNRLILGEPELIVGLSGLAVPLFGALPELAVVGAGEERFVLLTFVLEDRDALALHFLGRKRHGHFDLVDAPLLPRAAVEPDLAILHPLEVAQS